MTHDELRGLSGGYALGILSEAEHRAFAAHLQTCPECEEEVRGFAAVAAGLAQAVPQVEPPAALRERVLGAVSGTSQRAVAAAPARSPRRLFAFLSAAAALLAVGLGLYAASLQQRIRALEQELRVASARASDVQRQLVQYTVASDQSAQVRAILAAPDLKLISLAGQKAAPHTAGRAFWSPTLGLVVAFDNLPAASADRVYQLWVIPPGGTPISAGLLERQPDGRALALGSQGNGARVGVVAVTLEPAGGVPAPTGDMIVAGTISN